MGEVLTLSRGQHLIFKWKSVMLILISIWVCRIKSLTFMPVSQIYFQFYKTHIATSRTHQHYCDRAMGMLKTGNSVRTLESAVEVRIVESGLRDSDVIPV